MSRSAPPSDRDARGPDAGLLGCLGLALGGGAGGLAGVGLGVLVLGDSARGAAAAMVGAVACGFFGAMAGLALSPRLAVVPIRLSGPQALLVTGLAALAALGTELSPVPAATRWAPLLAFLLTAGATTAAFTRVGEAALEARAARSSATLKAPGPDALADADGGPRS